MSVATNSLIEQYTRHFAKSRELFQRAAQLFPNGVTHDGRHLKPFPVYVSESSGCRKQTVEGHSLLDYWMGHGSLILGHGHPAIVEAVQTQVARGTHWSACHELEIQWGEIVQQLVPSAEKLRFTGSGTEATLMALRLARIATGRDKVVKLAGHFHGWHDQLMPAADPPHDTGDYSQPGITESVAGDLVVVPPNDIDAISAAIEQHRPACVILEPTGGRWGTVPIRGEYLRALREVTAKTGTVLIFDEVITGFRVSPGGAQAHYGVTPDMTTLAKIVAGGLPGGCVVGKADLLQYIDYDNPSAKKMKHPGTYNGNPLSAAAGIAALNEVATGAPCRIANERAVQLRRGLNQLFNDKDVDWIAYGDFSLTKIRPGYTGPRPDSDDFLPYGNNLLQLDRPIDKSLTHAFRCSLLLNGVDWMGWGGIMSAAHTDADVEETVQGFAGAVELLRESQIIA